MWCYFTHEICFVLLHKILHQHFPQCIRTGPNMALFCISLISCFPGTLLRRHFEMVPVAAAVTGITFAFTFHTQWISFVRSLCFRIFTASFLSTFLSVCLLKLQHLSTYVILLFIFTDCDVRLIVRNALLLLLCPILFVVTPNPPALQINTFHPNKRCRIRACFFRPCFREMKIVPSRDWQPKSPSSVSPCALCQAPTVPPVDVQRLEIWCAVLKWAIPVVCI